MKLSDYGLIAHDSSSAPVGYTFGRLTVLATGRPVDTYRYAAVCQCSCGSAPKAIRIDGLVAGNVLSCGCLQKEATTTHGLTGTPLLGRWRHMIDRCRDPGDPAYPNYGGRGITVCERWNDAANFAADMASGFFPGADLDRIDNDGNYEPGNCRWSTRSANSDNRRNSRKLTHRGKTQSLTRWAEEVGIPVGTLYERVVKLGWDTARALDTPARSGRRGG